MRARSSRATTRRRSLRNTNGCLWRLTWRRAENGKAPFGPRLETLSPPLARATETGGKLEKIIKDIRGPVRPLPGVEAETEAAVELRFPRRVGCPVTATTPTTRLISIRYAPPDRRPAKFNSPFFKLSKFGALDSSNFVLPYMGTFYYNSNNYINLDGPTLKEYIKKQM